MVSYKNIEKFALVSVYDKSNLRSVCKTLQKYNIGIISTGSTYNKISKLGYKCFEISKLTKTNETLDGRVKTIHPKIYTSILFDRDKKEHIKTFKSSMFPKIDYVIVNLYPFEKFSKKNISQNEIIDMIDIGGPTLLRAASKNFKNVTTICSPIDYKEFCLNLSNNEGVTTLDFRKKMASKTFFLTHEYDKKIFNWLTDKSNKKINLRYGENPHQKSFLFKTSSKSFFDTKIQGKKISYNNILDINSGLNFLAEFKEPTAVIIKHNNACGMACSKNIKDAFIRAVKTDPKSAFGGIVLLNKRITSETATLISKKFFEVIVAPGFDKKSIKTFQSKKNLILIDSKKIIKKQISDIRSVRGGYLHQTIDTESITKKTFHIKSENKKISIKDYEDVIFAFKIVKHIKSNAIVLVKNKQLLGVGAGQMNRLDASKLAIMKYKENFKTKNYICASDAFFPFADSVKILANNGCKIFVQPGGSINDSIIIDYINKNNLKLLFSKKRVFKH